MNVAVIVATFGDPKWKKLALQRAVPSAHGQGAAEIIPLHLEEATLAEARNTAAMKTDADWLCFLDADDELGHGYLAEMEDAFDQWEHGREMAVYRGHPSTGPKFPLALFVPAVQYVGNPKWKHQDPPRVTPPRMLNQGRPLYELNWAVIATLIPRALFFEVGGFRDLAALEDWELWLRCERAGARLVDVPAAVYRVWLRENSRNTDQRLYRQIRAEYERAA